MSDTLSKLPVEIIYRILDEVSTCDILNHVCYVNQRLRAISLHYRRFHFDLTCPSNTKRRQFDKQCAQLVRFSSQVVSLTLAHDEDATVSAKIARFFSQAMFIHTNFSNLRSFSLSHVDPGIWQSFKLHRSSFLALTSISISISFINDDEYVTSLFISTAVTELLLFSSTLLHLTVKAYNSPPVQVTIVPSQMSTASSITHLTLGKIEVDLQTLLLVAPHLHSYTSTANVSDMLYNIHQLSPVHLQRLSITVEDIPLVHIERLLSSMKLLTHFTLIADGVDIEWVDGNRWARLLAPITTFKFVFTFYLDALGDEPLNLQSFQTNFWLLEKQWYVTFDSCVHGFQSLLYSAPYCLGCYPFRDMTGTFATKSTGPEQTSFLHATELKVVDCLSTDEALLRRCAKLNALGINAARLQCSFKWPDLIPLLNTSTITCVTLDTVAMTTSIDATVHLLNILPSVRSLRVSVSLLKRLLGYNWPHITRLDIIHGLDRLPKLFDRNQLDSLCRSFTHLQQFDFARSFFDNVAQLLNSMMFTLSHVYILHSPPITTDDEQFISHEWLKRNTKLRHFHYSCDRKNTVHLWL